MLFSEADSHRIAGTTRTLQIIVTALVLGLLSFLVTILFVRVPEPPKPPAGAGGTAVAAPSAIAALPVLTVAAFTFSVVLLPLSLLVPRLVVDASRKQITRGAWTPGRQSGATPGPTPATNVGKLAQVYVTQTIIGAAMNEGPAFFALIAYMLERSPIALGLFVVLLIGVALRFPRRAQVELWIDNQVDRLELDRQATKFA
jgi:hypothetical protein